MAPRDPKGAAQSAPNKRSPTTVDRALGTCIRRLRRHEGLTLRGLGNAIGVSAVQLQRYETGASRVAASRLVAIAKALGTPIGSLLGVPQEAPDALSTSARSRDVTELVEIFSDIRDPAHRSAILTFVRAMAPALDVPVRMEPAFAPVLQSGVNGVVPAEKS